MHFDRRSTRSETRSLLEGAPPSYHTINDVDEAIVPPDLADVPPINKFSKADIYWILAGLWSGVLLGAFDGGSMNHGCEKPR